MEETMLRHNQTSLFPLMDGVMVATDEHRQGRSVAESAASLDDAQEGAHNLSLRGKGEECEARDCDRLGFLGNTKSRPQISSLAAKLLRY